MAREIILGANQKFVTLVSDEDYEWLTQWCWQYKQSCRKWKSGVYAKRTTTVAGRKITLLMSHVILQMRMGLMRPDPDHDADHIDEQSLNNRRDNLQWLHKSPNRAHIHAPEYPEYAEAA